MWILLSCLYSRRLRIGSCSCSKHPNWFGFLLCHAKTLLLRYDGVWTSSPKQALGYNYVLAIEEGGVSLVVPQYMRDEIVSQCQKNLEAGHEELTKGGGYFFVDNRLQFLTVVLIAGGFWSAMDISSIAYSGEH
eukprot:g50807.t1